MRISGLLRDELEWFRRANPRLRDWADEVALATSVLAAVAAITFSGTEGTFVATRFILSIGAMLLVGILSSFLLGVPKGRVQLREQVLRLASRLTAAAYQLRYEFHWRQEDYNKLRQDLSRAAKLQEEPANAARLQVDNKTLWSRLAELRQVVDRIESTQSDEHRRALASATANDLDEVANQLAEAVTKTGRRSADAA
jgi:hypothetical protein